LPPAPPTPITLMPGPKLVHFRPDEFDAHRYSSPAVRAQTRSDFAPAIRGAREKLMFQTNLNS
jgi:hypothetical protein